MVFPFHRRRDADETDLDLGELLAKAKAGDNGVREQLLRKYIPFVAKSASRASSRYISRGEDDEFSIALAAFNEAIDRYDGNRGSSFLGFADTVIRRRLIDYFRSREVRVPDIPMAEFEAGDDEEHPYNRIEIQKSLEIYEAHQTEAARREEIERYSAWLAEFGISLEELVELSPKHADARWNAMQVAKVIASRQAFSEYLLQKKSLPLKDLVEEVGMSRKTLERQRKYIIAIALILIGDFEMLREYIA
ncbi:MAG: RNA polymerase sigma factor SigI [Kyrpidia sp.]|nr:RNA polymerase sigma factor SigI [Kyrpidia sp.]